MARAGAGVWPEEAGRAGNARGAGRAGGARGALSGFGPCSVPPPLPPPLVSSGSARWVFQAGVRRELGGEQSRGGPSFLAPGPGERGRAWALAAFPSWRPSRVRVGRGWGCASCVPREWAPERFWAHVASNAFYSSMVPPLYLFFTW